MSEVKIHWNTEDQETERVFSYLQEMEFYKKNNYQLSLPKTLGINSTKDEIKKQVSEEYNPEKFELKLNEIISDWKNIEKDFFKKCQTILLIDPLPTYECFVTQYGTGGSYNPPNQIIINIKSKFFGFYTIAHEMIHLLIHDLIEKNQIDHWQKERLVDHYFFKILNVDRYQKIPEVINVATVDEAIKAFSSQGAESVIRELHKKENFK